MALDGDALELQYRRTLEALAAEPGLVGTIFRKSQNKLSDPAKLKRVVSLVNSEGPWIDLDVDVKGEIYEGLLERNATEVRSDAGQYFTPRPVISAMVRCVDPRIAETVCDPACGTCGFLQAAFEHMKGQSQDRALQRQLRTKGLADTDIVDEVVRLCAMNLYLHGLGNGASPVAQGDSLASDGGRRYHVVLTNPPFGKESSYQVVGADSSVSTERENYEREDFGFTTSNKQLNFLQHIMTILDSHGCAGVVMPDNVLFFDKRPPRADGKPHTEVLWVYDLRTNVHKMLKTRPLVHADLDNFVRCWRGRQESERFRRFGIDELLARDKLNLDLFWLRDDSLQDLGNLPPPNELAAEIVGELQAALEGFGEVAAALATGMD